MRLLVTGGAGYIGSITAQLLLDGDPYVILNVTYQSPKARVL